MNWQAKVPRDFSLVCFSSCLPEKCSSSSSDSQRLELGDSEVEGSTKIFLEVCYLFEFVFDTLNSIPSITPFAHSADELKAGKKVDQIIYFSLLND